MRKTRLFKIVWKISALLLFVAGIAPSSRAQTVIAGNLGPGGSFQMATGTGWSTGPGGPQTCVEQPLPCDPANAVAFTIPANGPSIRMTQFKVAIDWFTGTNSVNVGLYMFAGPNTVANINSATLLQSYTLSSPAAMQGQPQLVTQVLATPIMLTPGNTYFLEMTEPNAGTDFGWQWNNTGQIGYYAAFLASLNSTPSWFAETCGGCTTPAFEVDGVAQGPFAYVGNQNDGTISVIDTSTGSVVAIIPLPACIENCLLMPEGLAVTPNGKFVYAATQFQGNQGFVQVIDTSTNAISNSINLCVISECASGPVGVAITPDGTRVYVTDPTQNAIEIIDTSTNMMTTSITHARTGPDAAAPGAITMSPDGSAAFFISSTNSIARIDTNPSSGTYNTVTSTITVGNNPTGIGVTPDGSRLYVTNDGDNTVSVITNNPPTFTPVATVPVGSGPYSVAITPDSSLAYIVNQSAGTVSVISNTAVPSVTATVSGLGATPNQIAITPNGRVAYVAVGGTNSVSPILTASNTLGTAIPVGAGPFGIAMGPAPTCTVNNTVVEACQTATLDASASTVTFAFDNTTHSIAVSVPVGWCATNSTSTNVPPCTVTATYADTPDAIWQTESANYPDTHIASITALGGDGAVYTLTCTDSTNAECFSTLFYATTMKWQSTQIDFCESGPAEGKEEPPPAVQIWENIEGFCSDDPVITGNSAPKLSRWVAFFGVTGTPSETVTITTPANGATYALGETVMANYACSPAPVPPAECAGTVNVGNPIDTSSLGMKTFTVDASTFSGPTAKAVSTYNVTSSYQFIGFSAPVKNPPDLNVVNAGRAIPVGFQVLDANNNPVLNLTAPPVTIVSLGESCASLDTTSDTSITATATGASGFQNLGGGFYQFNWATLKSWAGTCRQLQANLGDGVLHVADFQFK